jgi:hypothetical protein
MLSLAYNDSQRCINEFFVVVSRVPIGIEVMTSFKSQSAAR